jgi:hypothetical protein
VAKTALFYIGSGVSAGVTELKSDRGLRVSDLRFDGNFVAPGQLTATDN